MTSAHLSRRRALVVIGGAVSLLANEARADSTVPLQLQAQLVSKLGSFDRNFATRAGALARVLICQRGGDADSERVATHVAKGLVARRDVGGIAAAVEVDRFAGAQALADRCRAQKIALVYFATGLTDEMVATGKALVGVDVLTVGATASHAERGAVVGFDLEEGSPKIVANLAQAKAQNVAFKAELLKLARLVG